ncbi:hypothetical protein YC2023_094365 [Brassica napus]
MSKAASSVEVIGEWLKHPHVAQATRWRLYKKKKQPRLTSFKRKGFGAGSNFGDLPQ